MARTPKAIALLVACAVLTGCGGSGGSSAPSVPQVTPAPTAPPSGAAFDAVIQQSYAGGWGVELAIYKNGALVYAHGYGLRDRGLPDRFAYADMWHVAQPETLYNLPRGQFAPDANTIFDLASVSKEFTAGAILLLQQDGKLSVNDPLSKYFPGFPNGDAISLLYLLQHRSGLVDYNNFGSYPDFSGAYSAFMANGQTDYQPIVDRLATFPLDFAPGTQYEYSNTNYLLLGMIVAKVSGMTFGTFAQQRIFDPLGMTQTHQGNPPPPVTDIALGYLTNGGTAYRAWQWNLAWLAGAGGLTSTVGDLEKWDRAVRAPGIFTAASLAQMFAPSPIAAAYGSYADGWIVSALDGHAYVWHDGEVGGFQTINATFPNDGIDIIVLTNDGIGGVLPYSVIPQLFPLALSASPAQAQRRIAR
jgi:CubicO group peptidase (beta-lactamase class C family)